MRHMKRQDKHKPEVTDTAAATTKNPLELQISDKCYETTLIMFEMKAFSQVTLNSRIEKYNKLTQLMRLAEIRPKKINKLEHRPEETIKRQKKKIQKNK